MSLDYLLGSLNALLLMAYLLYALVRAERF